MRKLRACVALLLAASAQQVLAEASPASSGTDDALEDGFRDPPASARPRVWWHWMNGNVTKDGIAKDLAWMKRIGIGGVQNFDANIGTPQIVPERLVYMTPQWQDAFRFAARTANDLGLELAIASSPGWSETGGPWVPPADGMKKLVWSQIDVAGGRRFAGRLPDPPRIAGPYQDVPKSGQFGGNTASTDVGSAYGVIGVYAYRLGSNPLIAPVLTNAGVALADVGLLADGKSQTRLRVNTGTEQAPGEVEITYPTPQSVRSAQIMMPGQAMAFNDPTLLPRLEAFEGSSWRKLADMPLSTAATTVSFAPVLASRFRVVFAPNLDPRRASIAERRHPRSAMLAELALSGEPQIDQFETKSGLAVARDYYALAANADPGERLLVPASVVDLTDRMRADGSLDWMAPRGDWRIVRLGWSLTGTVNHPAPPEATGLEVDKYDRAAVRRYLATYLDKYRAATGPELFGKAGLRALLTDSTEVGTANWTPGVIDEFKRLRGYDPRPWLPALAGIPVGTRSDADRFLYDYRRTLADLHAEAHYATIAAVAREQGLRVYSEALEGGRPVLGDDMTMRKAADVPMAALWTWPKDGAPAPNYLADMKGASSIAHIYGQNIAAAETLTSNMQFWAHAPSDLKPVIDLAFASGVNLPVIHTSVHQPVDDKVPGLSLAVFGQFFTRHETWAEMARPWIDYIARSAYLLQQGRNVADLAYFYGEEAPLVELYRTGMPADAPKQHAWDFIGSDAILNAVRVEDGKVVTSGGARYNMLFLGGTSQHMTLPVLRKLAELVEAGATVAGIAPQDTPSLADNRDEFALLRARLWNGSPIVRIGKGTIINAGNSDAALELLDLAPGLRPISQSENDAPLKFVEREFAGGRLYFVTNPGSQALRTEVLFRVTGKRPEIWRAETGGAEPVSYRIMDRGTSVPLNLAPGESVFLVFRDPATQPELSLPERVERTVTEIDKGWSITFQPARGGPRSPLALERLGPLNEMSDPAVRYFSGTATYSVRFNMRQAPKPGEALWLDLGNVGDLAEVRINGAVAGTAWHAPWRLNVGGHLRKGQNQLEVRVANLWVNRLIGDAQPDATKVTWTALRTYGKDAPLRPAGLIGPVRIVAAE